MDSPDAPVRRIITHVYSRKRGREQRDRSNNLPRLDSTCNVQQIAKKGEVDVEAMTLAVKITSTKASTTSQASPSTPPRKRPSQSQRSSSSLSSSCSPSKVSIDREINRIFSPKGKLAQAKQFSRTGSDDEGQGDTVLLSGSLSEYNSLKPSKPSFADRMLPRKQKETPPTLKKVHSDDTILSTIHATASSTSSQEKLKENLTTGANDRIPSGEPLPLLELSTRIYQRTRSFPTQQTKKVDSESEEANEGVQSCMKDLKKRWAELEDLDKSDEEHIGEKRERKLIRNNMNLRRSARSQKFVNDWQYHVLDLSPALAIEVRRSASVALAEVILSSMEDDEGEQDDEIEGIEEGDEEAQSKSKERIRASQITSLSPFLKEVKTAELTGQLWTRLRQIGAGDGDDEVLDLVLALFCFKVFHCDAEMAQSLCKQSDFMHCMTRMMREYPHEDQNKTRDQHIKCLTIMTSSLAFLHASQQELKVSLLVLSILANFIERLGQSPDLIDLAHVEDGINMTGRLWEWIATEAKHAKDCIVQKAAPKKEETATTPNDQAVRLIAHTLSNRVNQGYSIDNQLNCESSTSDVLTLMRFFASGSCDTSQGESLASLLRLTVSLMASENEDWNAALLKVDGVIRFLVGLTCQMSSHLIKAASKEDQRTGRELCNLCVALMTNFLMKSADEVRQVILMDSPDSNSRGEDEEIGLKVHPIHTFGRLLRHEKEKVESDPDADYLIGSLTVVLGLLLVDETESEERKISQTTILKHLCKGMQYDKVDDCLNVIIGSLDEFAALMQLVSYNCYTIRELAGKGDEAKEDEAFFRRLSNDLTSLRQIRSSADN